MVFTLLVTMALTVNLKKCKFFAYKIDYLGHVIGPVRL